MNILELLDGKKTYICIGLGALVFISSALGYLTPEVAAQLYVLLGLGGAAAMRSAIS